MRFRSVCPASLSELINHDRQESKLGRKRYICICTYIHPSASGWHEYSSTFNWFLHVYPNLSIFCVSRKSKSKASGGLFPCVLYPESEKYYVTEMGVIIGLSAK